MLSHEAQTALAELVFADRHGWAPAHNASEAAPWLELVDAGLAELSDDMTLNGGPADGQRVLVFTLTDAGAAEW